MKTAIFVGHVGKDSGAIDGAGNDNIYTIEAVVTQAISFKIAHFLKVLGNEHRLVDGDWVTRLTESSDCDVGISIHADVSAHPEARGFHLIYYQHSEEGRNLADCIDRALDIYARRNRAPHPRNNLIILRKTPFPCVIVETGFISNTTEEAQLGNDEYQWNLAFQIVVGLRSYIYR
jgi:N-acetylmuramoyl-L-alanine amidase